MKIAFVSDIHGNQTAFETVLRSIEAEHVDKIFCLGDICYGGPQPAECLELVRKYADVCVMGNTDQAIVRAGLGAFSEDTRVLAAMQSIRDDGLSYLLSLPSLSEMKITSNMMIKAFHGTVESVSSTYQVGEMESIAANQPEQALHAFGHTHRQFFMQIGLSAFFNPGSVGSNRVRNTDGSKRILSVAYYGLVELGLHITVVMKCLG